MNGGSPQGMEAVKIQLNGGSPQGTKAVRVQVCKNFRMYYHFHIK